MIKKFNDFHIVSKSPWPVLASTQAQRITITIIRTLAKKSSKWTSVLNLLVTIIIALLWWKDTSSEAREEGAHLKKTIKRIKISIIIFIASEVLFFSRFFWAYFHSGRRPNVEIGQTWPPKQIESFNPINVPLLNTIILVRSGFSITWSHHMVTEKKINKGKNLLLLTCLLGLYFTILQKIEYDQSQFCINDSTYGTTFFVATGFHGIHVMLGTIFLLVNFVYIKKISISENHHIGFELAAWYWHFVDVVWLILYLSIYWWGK